MKILSESKSKINKKKTLRKTEQTQDSTWHNTSKVQNNENRSFLYAKKEKD